MIVSGKKAESSNDVIRHGKMVEKIYLEGQWEPKKSLKGTFWEPRTIPEKYFLMSC